MVNIQKIRGGLLSISWAVHNLALQNPSRQEVAISPRTKIFKSCSLICRLEYNSVMVLEVQTEDPPDSLKDLVVTTTYDSVAQKMTLNESTWTASWNCFNRPTEIYIEILIDFKPDFVVSMKKGSKQVLKNLQKLWEHKTGSDVTFKCGDEVIKAHTLILASGSPILSAMFRNDFRENRERMVLIEDIQAKIFENLLQYIYVGKCALLENADKDENEVADLLIAADKYNVASLKEECELYFSRILTVENAIQYLIFASLHSAPELKESVLDFMAKNIKIICSREEWRELIKINQDLFFEATQHLLLGM